MKLDQLFAVGVGKGPQQDAIDEAEHGGIDADSQRQGEEGDEGESGCAADQAQREPHIVQQSTHPCRLS